MKISLALVAVGLFAGANIDPAYGQSLGNAGTIEGTVVDQSGAAIPKAEVHLSNPVTGYSQTITAGPDGSFRLTNIPPNPYRLEVNASGFGASSQEVDIRNSVPVQVKATLAVAGTRTSVTVEAAGTAIVENDPSAHVDVDRSQMLKIPAFDPGASLSEAIVYSTGGRSEE